MTPAADIAAAVRSGYEINLPPRTVLGNRDVEPIVTSSNPAIVVEAVKLAEDRSGDVIVRLYESLGARSSAWVIAGFPASSVTVTDLLERPRESTATRPGQIPGGSVDLEFRPFEIITLRLRRA